MKTKRNRPIANIENPIEVFRKLANWFNNRGFVFCLTTNKKAPLIAVIAGGDHCNFFIIVHIDSACSCVDFSARLGIRIPDSSQAKVREFILRSNKGACTSYLGFIAQNKEVCAVSRIPLTTAAITDDEITVAVDSVGELIDACTPPLITVVFGNVEPAEAVKNIHAYHRPKESGHEFQEISIPRS